MSQRLIKSGLSVATSRIIGYKNGSPVWLALGGAPDDNDDPNDPNFTGDDDSDDEEDDEGDDEEEDDKAKKKKVKSKNDDEDEDDEDDRPRYSTREYEKLKTRMKAADKRASDTETRLRTLENKDKKPEEITSQEAIDAKAKADKLAEDNRTLRLHNAFLASNTVDWVDPEDALHLVDLSDVDVDDDGIVDRKALARALRDLAKRKPHLVKKSKASGKDDDDEEDDEDQGSRRSANTMNGKRKGSRSGTDRAALEKRFPALSKGR